MPEQSKFENVDLFASLEAIMKQNTGFYQSDLDIDKEIIAKAAASPNREDKTLLWFCRPSGTHCFRERDVFLKDTAPHNTWRFYMEQTSDRVLAYAIELTGTERGKIKGNLYELDYAKHLQYCRSLPTLDEVQARNGNYRQAIIRPFTAALDRLEDLEIIGWNWKINEGEEFPKNYNDFLKEAVKYSMAGMPEGA